MKPAVDYRIYQRDAEGFASILVAGDLPGDAPEGAPVCVRVCREEDGLTVLPWTQCTVEGGKWQNTLRVPEGGLYRIETCVGTEDVAMDWRRRIQNVRHVGVGELFMIAGQSNMAGYGRDTAFDPPQLGVHLYANSGRWEIATHPLNDSIDTIYPENTETASGASPLLSFARQIRRSLNVPVGLVQASLGGTPLSYWNPEEDGRLYRAMLRRLDATGPVGAVLWYQGCSDAARETADTYFARFTRMVSLWREALGDVPFVTVQLNRWTNLSGGLETDRFWGIVREAQRQAARRIPDVCIVPATDLFTTDGIHNSSGGNVILGERMANVYLQSHYHLPGLRAPDVEQVRRIDDTHLYAEMTPGADVLPIDGMGCGIDAEDENGLIACTAAEAKEDGLLLTLERPCGQDARLHMIWRAVPPVFLPRSRHGMPILSCYGVPVE